MNKRQAKFIMKLPDGYEWTFVSDCFLCGYNGDKILSYEIVNDELIQREIKYEQNYL